MKGSPFWVTKTPGVASRRRQSAKKLALKSAWATPSQVPALPATKRAPSAIVT
jgi:hypothetical protein